MEIPGYEIVREIGKGGMAKVYLAIQESLDREVAIKVMSPFLNEDATFGERFIREAKIVAQLSHTNIVSVYDAGKIGEHYYLAMEYRPGGDLKQKIAQGLSEQQAVIIMRQIAAALQYAHDKSIVHRDVKPANIIFDQQDHACLTDFGVAKAYGSATTTLTVAGSTIGTPTYMSPEQARGEAIDHRTDLYSLGVVFYEMLSGQPPFHGDSGVTVAIKHISEPVPALDPKFSRYQTFLNKLLAKNPDERWQSANEIIHALDNILQTDSPSPTLVRPVATPATTQVLHTAAKAKSSQKLAWSITAAALVAVSAVAMVLVFKPALIIKPGPSDLAQQNQQQPSPAKQPALSQHDLKINHYVEMAETAVTNEQYLLPKGNNALEWYQKILALDPNNITANAGINQITNHYITSGRNATQKGDIALAEDSVKNAERIAPNHPELTALKEDVESLKREQLKQQQARQNKAKAKLAASKPKTTKPPTVAHSQTSTKTGAKTASPASKPVAVSKTSTTAIVTESKSPTPSAKPKATLTSQTNSPSPTATKEKLTETASASQQLNQTDSGVQSDKEKVQTLEEQIQQLSNTAYKILSKKDLTLQDIDLAYKHYQDIDKLSPNHHLVKEGYFLVVGACADMANRKIQIKDYAQARLAINKGLSIDNRNRPLRILKKRLR